MGSLGKHLRAQLEAMPNNMAITRCYSALRQQLRGFDGESRVLFKLVGTPRAVQILQRTVDSALGILGLFDKPDRVSWHEALQLERDEQVDVFNALLGDDEWLESEIGCEREQLELLMLMKHGVLRYGDGLNPRELDLISGLYDAVVRRSNVVVGDLPDWFATSEHEWSLAVKSPVEGEEQCVRQAAISAELLHSNIRKFYGAYYVGQAFFIHEPGRLLAEKGAVTWGDLLGCARGLHYLHERGLVHQNLSTKHLLYSNFYRRGFLSGIGLVQLDKNNNSAEVSRVKYARALDIQAFGFSIFELRYFKVDDVLQTTRPEFVLEDEWDLMTAMCTAGPSSSLTTEDILYKIEVLARNEAVPPASGEHVMSGEAVVALNSYEIQSLGQTITSTLDDIEALCLELEEFSEVNRPVCARLKDVYEQLDSSRGLLPVALVENFALIVLHFYDMLDQRTIGIKSDVSSLVTSKTRAGKMYGLHQDIDRLLRSIPWLDGHAVVHCWQQELEETRIRQNNELHTAANEPLSAVRDITSEDGRAQALAVLQYEASKLNDLTTKCAVELPRWFIPPHQLKLGNHIASGAFGAVYEAAWLGTDIVVKQVFTDQTDSKSRIQFRNELDLWFGLNHSNLIKLYGACHEGRPFFVCERATYGTLASFVREKHRKEIWFCLWDAAKGLQHLHDHGIVHGDLKGNNILVCDEYRVKLADFGLSTNSNRDTFGHDAGRNMGAIRWKAPECLVGSRPTTASDMYSFGMCVIEAMTGQFPWGNVPDDVVKHNVLKKKVVPPRPRIFNDSEWELVLQMCHHDPQRRITIGAVVSMIYNFSI
ncbi:hypothetical protein ON010_g12779 [Phytophthora cinnamomi]|nr:hypothetical protein ON010_g12779 [Phytophthora cinnamomi]